MFEESTDMDLKTFHCEMDSGHEAVAGPGVLLFMRLWRWMMWLSRCCHGDRAVNEVEA